jgi:hypothetical protein
MKQNPSPGYPAQSTLRKHADKERKIATRAHEVPSQIMPCLRKAIIGAFIAGRSVKQIANEYCVTQGLTLELVIRAEMEIRRVEAERAYQPTRLRLIA